jgi:ABC-type transport system substrate-binding protein/PKD repeat protein
MTAVILAFVVIGAPAINVGVLNGNISPVGQAAAQPEGNYRVGVIGFIDDVKTLNPFEYTMAAEWMVIWPCYSTLIMWDLDGNFIGDLAESWDVSPNGKIWNFTLVDNAYFYDSDDPTPHQVTADDVKWTFDAVASDTKNHLHSYFPDVGDPAEPLVSEIIVNGPLSLTIETSAPFAPFLSGIGTIPIVPKYIWELEDPLNYDNPDIIGSGPFYFGEMGELEGTLHRNPNWFQEENRGWQLHIDQLTYKSYTAAEPALDALLGDQVDCMMGVTPDQYLDSLPGEPGILRFGCDTGFVYEFNLNQMTDELRDTLTGPIAGGTNSQILQDPAIKHALAMCIDKETFVSDVLRGLGTVADSLVPSVNPWHYTYGSEEGEDVVEFNTAAARDMLEDAGYEDTDSDDVLEVTASSLAYQMGWADVGDNLEFRFTSLIPEVEWSTGAALIQGWCAEAGVQLNLELKSSNEMNNDWYAADYDSWLWDWIFTPLSDPSTDILSVCTTMEIGSWSDLYWSNVTFDSLYNRSLLAVDVDARRQLTDEMQRMLYEDFACQCIAYRQELYAASTDHWTNLGNWSNEWMLMPDQALPWLYMRMSPNTNHAPSVQVNPAIDATMGEANAFSATIDDDESDTLEYKWIWGDGTSTGWIAGSSGGATHTYDQDGVFTAYVVARETSTAMGLTTWNETKVTVYDFSNDAPQKTGDGIEYTPLSPDTGDSVEFTPLFTDDEGDELSYTWNFGDTYTAVGEIVTHQYMTPGTYEVTVSVTDNHQGTGERPVTASVLIAVVENEPPTLEVPDFPNVVRQDETEFHVFASDPESDPLRYTWYWGDNPNAISVTTEPYATHTYTQAQDFTLRVYADDLTGLPGHNVTDTGEVHVKTSNVAPVIDDYSVSTNVANTGEMITFSGTAHEPEGEAMTFTFEFSPTDSLTFVSDPTTDPVTFEFEKAFEEAGNYNTVLYVNDGAVNVSSSVELIEVSLNLAPTVSPLDDVTETEGVEIDFYASAIDPDGDDMTYWWDFDDGEYASGQDVSHTYGVRGDYNFAVYVDDGNGHNVSVNAWAYIRAIPVLTPLEDTIPLTVEEGSAQDFTAEATDADGDDITYTWDFGDGSDLEVGQTVSHAFPVTGVNTDYTVTVWADDGSGMAGHNVSDSAIVSSLVSGEYAPIVGKFVPKTGIVDVEVRLNISAMDPDGDPLTYTWDFENDGTPDQVTMTNYVFHTYTVVGDYQATVHVYDGMDPYDPTHNISRTGWVNISDDAPPTADAGPDQEVDEDTIVYFDGAASYDDVGIAHYDWYVVELDVTLDDAVDPMYTFSEPGIYTVTLTVEDTIGQLSDADEMTVTVLDVTSPTADAGPDQTVDFGDLVAFDGSGSSDNVNTPEELNYTWVLNDDGAVVTLYEMDPTYTFTVPGEFTVRLWVEDDAGLEGYDEMIVTVVDDVPPVADAGADQDVDQGTNVVFDGTGTTDNSGIAEYLWEFDYDGAAQTLYGSAPSFDFDIPGVYTVTLTVTDLGDNTDTDTVVITVRDTGDPVADAGADQSVDVGDTVTFDGSGSTDNVEVVNYTWTFEYDGATETLFDVDPTFTFDIAGDYTVTLTVEDAEANSDTDTVVISVAAADEPPVADAGADQTVDVGDTVTFDGSGSTDDSEIVNYTWTFEYDGAPETLYDVDPTFTFDIVGTYTVTLTVEDDGGATDEDTVVITVEEPSAVTLAADAGSDQTVTVGDTVTFDGGDSTGDIVSYTWTFEYDGETETLTGESPTFAFDIAGEYTVTLTVEDADGDTDTDTVTITVEEEEDDEKSFIEQYGLPIGLVVALLIVALLLFFVMKKRKGGKAPAELDGLSAGEPEVLEAPVTPEAPEGSE